MMEYNTLGCGSLIVGKSELCRLCMKKGEYYISLFLSSESSRPSIRKVIEDLLNLDVAVGDGLPRTVCCRCFSRVMEFKEFKEMCMNSAEELRKIVQDGSITCDGVVKVEPSESADEGEVNFIETSSCVEVDSNVASDPLQLDNLLLEGATVTNLSSRKDVIIFEADLGDSGQRKDTTDAAETTVYEVVNQCSGIVEPSGSVAGDERSWDVNYIEADSCIIEAPRITSDPLALSDDREDNSSMVNDEVENSPADDSDCKDRVFTRLSKALPESDRRSGQSSHVKGGCDGEEDVSDSDLLEMGFPGFDSASPASENEATSCSRPRVKRKRKTISLGVKLEVLRRVDAGQRQHQICKALSLAASTVRSITMSADKIRKYEKIVSPMDVDSILIRPRSETVMEMERLLRVWMRDRIEMKKSVSLTEIQAKARRLYDALAKARSDPETFIASRGWFDRFKRRYKLQNLWSRRVS